LAEHAIPDAPYYEEDWDDLSRFEYWNDIEYDSDGYNDIKTKASRARRKADNAKNKQGKKRKAVDTLKEAATKRRKQDLALKGGGPVWPPVLLLSKDSKKKSEGPNPRGKHLDKLSVVSLLPDWETRFKNIEPYHPEIVSKSNNDERPAETGDDEAEAVDETNDDEAPLTTEMLKLALQRNLQGLNIDAAAIDENMLLQLAQRMLKNEEVDDMLDEYAEEIIEDDEDGDGDEDEEVAKPKSFNNWVTSKAKAADGLQTDAAHRRPAAQVPSGATSSLLKGENQLVPQVADAGPSSKPGSIKRRANSPEVSPRRKKNRRRDELSARG